MPGGGILLPKGSIVSGAAGNILGQIQSKTGVVGQKIVLPAGFNTAGKRIIIQQQPQPQQQNAETTTPQPAEKVLTPAPLQLRRTPDGKLQVTGLKTGEVILISLLC